MVHIILSMKYFHFVEEKKSRKDLRYRVFIRHQIHASQTYFNVNVTTWPQWQGIKPLTERHIMEHSSWRHCLLLVSWMPQPLDFLLPHWPYLLRSLFFFQHKFPTAFASSHRFGMLYFHFYSTISIF